MPLEAAKCAAGSPLLVFGKLGVLESIQEEIAEVWGSMLSIQDQYKHL